MNDADLYIRPLTPALEERIRRNHSLNIDTFIIPSPFIKDEFLEKDYDHSYVWEEEGELLGYILVYSNPERSRLHLYKQITSPFGRGKGIGSAFIRRLTSETDPEALLYLIIWEKQQDAILFFSNKGFTTEDRIVYRGLSFFYMEAKARNVRTSIRVESAPPIATEELGKTRHDARKTLRLLSDMVDRLNPDNCNKIIEDINRETTALINMLNAYRDAMEQLHEVNVKTLVIERILPFIEMSQVHCEVRLVVRGRVPEAYGHYLDIGRALINLASNALDAIHEAGRRGRIGITLEGKGDFILLIFQDNGIGMEPERLELGDDGLPRFLGRTTKEAVEGRAAGQGIGTRQIFAVFGAENIEVKSVKGRGTTWCIKLRKRPPGDFKLLRTLEYRYRELHDFTENILPGEVLERSEVASLIWRLRKMEVFSWDLILQFAKYNNIRELYRTTLSYRFGTNDMESLKDGFNRCRIDYPEVRGWLTDILEMIKRDEGFLARRAAPAEFGAILLKSYGQATDRTIIFTLDPGTGNFFATDRKLAEHVDFAGYLYKERDELLRGELSGDVSDPKRPIMLGVWSIRDAKDAKQKIRLLRQGARKLIEIGIKPEKRLGFYQTTYVHSPVEINSYITSSLKEFAETPDEKLDRFLVDSDDEIPSFVVTD
jgi:GNAT superfamily N-acetyltransferase